jgi:hypothetical protein
MMGVVLVPVTTSERAFRTVALKPSRQSSTAAGIRHLRYRAVPSGLELFPDFWSCSLAVFFYS